MNFTIEVEQEEDERMIAEIPALPGVLAYGESREEAIVRAKALALRVLADRLEHGEGVPEMANVFSVADEPMAVNESAACLSCSLGDWMAHQA